MTATEKRQPRPGDKGLNYLADEVKKEREQISQRLLDGSLEPLVHAQLDDLLRWMNQRIATARLVERD